MGLDPNRLGGKKVGPEAGVAGQALQWSGGAGLNGRLSPCRPPPIIFDGLFASIIILLESKIRFFP